jgi:hypothetical protein
VRLLECAVQCLMRPGTIEIVTINLHEVLQVTLTEDQDMVNAFATDTAQTAFTDRVSLQCLKRWAMRHIEPCLGIATGIEVPTVLLRTAP